MHRALILAAAVSIFVTHLTVEKTDMALAHELMESTAPTLEQARHDRAAIVANWPLARDLALRLANGAPPMLADDLTTAIARGDVAVAAAQRAETAEDIETAVWIAWSVISHVVNIQPVPIGT